jgi:lauroyl/myristoyl acyltransferase
VSLSMMRGHGLTVRMRAEHLRRVLAATTGREPEPEIMKRMTTRAYLAYARYWVDGARLPATAEAVVVERMRAIGREHLDKGMAAGGGVIMALPHVGSWEWGGSWLESIGYRMTAVAEILEPPKLFRWFIKQRNASGLDIVPLDQHASAEVIKVLRDGRLVGLLCDRDLVGNGIEVEFFGEMTTFPAGPATLALRTGAMLITTAVFAGPGTDHLADMSAPIDTSRTGSFREDVTRITQQIARNFEEYIKRAPEQWHMFQPLWPSEREAELARRQD